jgi:hypothetical protein
MIACQQSSDERVEPVAMISPALRMWLYILAAGYGAMGAILFVAPDWAAKNFAWSVSPFVAMTIGGWCIGTAWACIIVARRGNWPAMLCPILYLAFFGVFETAVVIAFKDRLLTGNPLTWLYCAMLAGTVLFAIAAGFEAVRRRPILLAVGPPLNATTIGIAVAFILLVGFLGLYGLTAVPGMRGLNASIFPEQLSPFSLRAFGAFYFSLALAVIPLLWTRGMGNLVNHGFALYGLLVFITVAAFVFIDRFDFVGRPTQLIYIGIYLLVGAIVGVYLVRYGTGALMDRTVESASGY